MSDATFMIHLGSDTTANARHMQYNGVMTFSVAIRSGSDDIHLFLPPRVADAEAFIDKLVSAAETLREQLPLRNEEKS